MTENNSIPEGGILIPREVLDLKNVTSSEKAFLGLIYSLGNKCQLTNRVLGKLMNTTEKNASNYIFSLKKKGYLSSTKDINTNTRILTITVL